MAWAVEMLAVAPSDHLLEIGCGRGAAVSLVCLRLATGKVLAIDRSLTMTRIAERRNLAHVAAGRAVFQTAALDAADLAGERFDKIFAVNVNLFWVRSAIPQLDLVRRLLKPGGALYLFHEPPTVSRAKAFADRLVPFLTEQGFATTSSTATTRRRTSLLCLIARPAAG